MMTVREYVDVFYDGNLSAFARDVGKRQARVWTDAREGYLVHKGRVFMPSRSYGVLPDPLTVVERGVLDRFQKRRGGQAAVERLEGGMRWSKGQVVLK